MVAKSFHIVGDGAAHSFGAALNLPPASRTSFQVKWFQVVPANGNAGQVRIGGSEVSSTVGFPLPVGGAQFLPDISELSSRYELYQNYFYAAVGDVLEGLYAVD